LIDDSGEDYLYPEKFFDAVSMQASTEKRI